MTFLASYDLTKYEYRCDILDSLGYWYSDAVTVEFIYPSLSISANTTSAAAGTRITLTATTSNFSSTASYLWQFSEDDSDWADQSTAVSAYSFYLSDANAGYYRLKIKDTNGWTWTSNKVKITLVQEPKYRALLIGNDDYTSSSCTDNGQVIHFVDKNGSSWTSSFPDLGSCINDMNAMGTMLTGITNAYTSIRKVSNATASTILSSIAPAFSGATENDVSLFYYSGHGYGFSEDILPYNMDKENLQGGLGGVDAEIVKLSELVTELNKVPGTVILLLDCCQRSRVGR